MKTSQRLDVYTIIHREGMRKPFWLRIGIAWVNKDGSINVTLDAVPVNGKLNIREYKQRDGDSDSGGGEDVPF